MTVVDINTPIQGTASVGILGPSGMTVYDGNSGESLMVVDTREDSLLHIPNVLSTDRNVSVLFKTWPTGEQFNSPGNVLFDKATRGNVYVSDASNDRVMLFSSMQAANPIPRVVAGISSSSGNTPGRLQHPYGMALDSQSNLYVADSFNN
jgi:hypothetical protein